MNFQFEDGRPIYLQLVEEIELLVATEKYKAGERLPSVRDMASQWSVNPNTMQRALITLEDRGLLKTISTSGRFVTDDTQLIFMVRQSLANNLTKIYKEKMTALGYSNSEIIDFLNHSFF